MVRAWLDHRDARAGVAGHSPRVWRLGKVIRMGQPLFRHSSPKLGCHLRGIANAEREARPDRRAEIERHPGNLVLPFGDVVGHDPANCSRHAGLPADSAAWRRLQPRPAIASDTSGRRRSPETPDNPRCRRSRRSSAARNVPSNSGSSRQSPTAMMKKATAHIEFSIALPQIIPGQHRMPRETFCDQDQRHDHPRGVHGGVRSRHRAELVQDERPLRRETHLGHGRDRPPDHDAREPRIEQTDPLHIRAREQRPECTAEHIRRAQQEHQLDADSAAETAGLRSAESDTARTRRRC